jgi:pimeloyl-ACP methyl ester carboxylesterase
LIPRVAAAAAVVMVCMAGLWAQAAKAEKGFAPIGDTRLYYETAGKGPVVVLIHGGLVDSRLWDDQFYEFARKFRVVRYDLRGYGRSDFPTAPFSHVDDLAALLKFLKIKKASLVGLSVGGNVALDMAISHPDVVDKLVLAGSGLRGNNLPPNKENAAVYKAAEEKGMEMAINMWLQNTIFATAKNDPVFEKRMRTMLADNYRYWGPTPEPIPETWAKPPTAQRLGEIKKPTLIIVSEKDAPTLLGIADILKAKIAGSKKVVFPNVSHHLNMEIPAQFNKAVMQFLSK